MVVKMSLISMAAVLGLTVCVCLFSVNFITDVCGEMEEVHEAVMDYAESGQAERAHGELRRMAQFWKRQEDVMAVLVPHESIHEITGLLIQAEACLKAGDTDEFFESMAHVKEALGHMQEDERFTLSNILQVC